ncbi:hypothetical protein Y032_0371g129 [Ancylostoma ceylanicum]|uniref:Uncharacterized protein n=1 Tax=Ancylostoma ceylanicum TaxID=53326 RepID=A0A016RUA4_9BILA|nr:hypothetical protein Y032_0371g129 [Ancylostoma ceylanicum]
MVKDVGEEDRAQPGPVAVWSRRPGSAGTTLFYTGAPAGGVTLLGIAGSSACSWLYEIATAISRHFHSFGKLALELVP